MNNKTYRLLRKTARLLGIQIQYLDAEINIIWSNPQTLIYLVQALTESTIKTDEDYLRIIKQKKEERFINGSEPSCHKWQNQRSWLNLYLTSAELNQKISFEFFEENSKKMVFSFQTEASQIRHRVELPELALGYYQIKITTAKRSWNTFFIMAPQRLENLYGEHKSWGLFAPLYALKSQGSMGVGSFSDLSLIAEKFKPEAGLKWIGTLPILASSFDHPESEISPYSSLSRLFWNELYLDVALIAQKQGSKKTLKFLTQTTVKNKIDELNAQAYANHFESYQIKKQALEILSAEFYKTKLDQTQDYQEFLQLYPLVTSYAQFRSKNTTSNQDKNTATAVTNYHIYCQYQCHLSIKDVTKNIDLYMDYPVGVNREGFDYQYFKSVFFDQANAGAPPEPVFRNGQDWSFPALHPTAIRKSNYQYLRQTLKSHFTYSKLLRVDHVMGLHRIYVIPKGWPAHEGAYIRYKPQEMFAILCLEAFLAKADVVGENLGVVPDAVDHILYERNIKGMTVGQFLLDAEPGKYYRTVNRQNLFCLNTHDMGLFRAFVWMKDLDLVTHLGIIDHNLQMAFKHHRDWTLGLWRDHVGVSHWDQHEFFMKFLSKMAHSPAQYVLLNPEDTWAETEPQNVPGTTQFPNWKRKMRLPIEQWENESHFRYSLDILKSRKF